MYKINVNDIDPIVIMKTHCDLMEDKARELKALFNYKSKHENIIELNKTRALENLNSMISSLNEIKLYLTEN